MSEKTELEKMLSGELYDCGAPELLALWHKAKDLTRAYSALDTRDLASRDRILSALLGGRGKNLWIAPPFQVDYGKNIFIGENCEINTNCIFLDANRIEIGKNALIASGVQLLTPFHPTSARERFGAPKPDGSFEFCKSLTAPIKIGDNVWLGAGTIVLPGVTIGDNVVVGAGSVVTRDIPSNVVAFGNPCRVRRENRSSR